VDRIERADFIEAAFEDPGDQELNRVQIVI